MTTGSQPAELTRRRLLHLTGAAGAAAVLGACSQSGIATTTATPSTAPTAPAGPVLAPALPPLAPPAVPTPVASGMRLCRDAWGARPPRPGGVQPVAPAGAAASDPEGKNVT